MQQNYYTWIILVLFGEQYAKKKIQLNFKSEQYEKNEQYKSNKRTIPVKNEQNKPFKSEQYEKRTKLN